MFAKILQWNKTQKTEAEMEAKINDLLSKNKFVYATQMEDPSTAKLTLTLYLAEGESPVRAKVVRSVAFNDYEEKLTEFLSEGHKMKLPTQSCVGSTAISILFHEPVAKASA